MLTTNTSPLVQRDRVANGARNLYRKPRGFVGTLLLAGIACAHAQEPAATAAEDVVMEEVVVTGTSIQRSDDAALPVTVMSREEMDLRDAGSPVELLTSLPAVTGVPLNESTQGGAGARGDVASIAMRGLGSGSTLVLLNGRRMAAHGISANENGVPAPVSYTLLTLPTKA